VTHTEALQTLDANAQFFERRIHSLWSVFDRDPIGNVGSEEMRRGVERLAHDLTRSDIPYEDWQIIYRELLQLDREIMGLGQLLDGRKTIYAMHEAAHHPPMH
jgi:hypothetical protein